MKSAYYLKRIEQMQKRLEGKAYLIEESVDLFYLTGLTLSAGRLLILPEKAVLFVDGRYINACKESSPIPVELDSISTFQKHLGSLPLFFDPEKMSYARVEKLRKTHSATPSQNPIKELRLIKDELELHALQKSADLLYEGFLYLKTELKEGVSEVELARAFEIFCLKNGAEKLSFDPIIAFGPDSAMPHHRAGSKRLESNQIVLIDIGVVVDRYCSDMTRVVFFGTVSDEILELEDVVRRSQEAALALCTPGTPLGDVDAAARAIMAQSGLEDLYLHTLGHGVGLEIHEYPRLKKGGDDAALLLMPGMVVTIEPGLYKAGIGGVRIEDTIVITEEGYQFITTHDL